MQFLRTLRLWFIDQREMLLRAMVREPDWWWSGSELARAAGVPSGSIYPSLERLEADGLVMGRFRESSSPGPRRRFYRLTSAGKEAALEA
ncbi:PadR family transcriptional regulator [Candidatus Parcubacteria bacterium]|nr:PadR family transcriptional regulator [Candidatus Parcubacteria bacterium]